MAGKPGFLQALPILAPLAGLATGGLALPGLFGAELAGDVSAGAAGTAATLAEGGGALPTAGALLAAPATEAVGTGVATPLSAGALSSFSDAAISGLPDAVSGLGGAAGSVPDAATAGAIPAATQAIGDTLPAGAAATPANQLPPLVSNTFFNTLQPPNDPSGAVAPAGDFIPANPALGEQDFTDAAEGGDFLSKATTSLNNPLVRAGVAGGGLLASGLMNTGTPTGSAPLTAAAGTSTTNAANLRSLANPNLNAINTGALPAGAQSAIQQATGAAKASIRSKFAGMGLSNSTMEGQELASVDQQAATQRFQQSQELAKLGLQESGLASGQEALASEDFLALMNARLRQDQNLQNALARFSAGFAGGTGGGGTTA